MSRLITVTTIKQLYKLNLLLKAIIKIKQYAKKRLINFTNETSPSAKLSATSNEIIEIITTNKNDKKCFLCLKFVTNSLKLKLLIMYVKAIMLMRDIKNICG